MLRNIAASLRTSTSIHNDRHMTDDSRNWLTDLARRIDMQADRVERELPFNAAVSDGLAEVKRAIGVDAPDPTLTEELQEWAEETPEEFADWDGWDRFNALIDRAEQIEQERDTAIENCLAMQSAAKAAYASRDKARSDLVAKEDEVERLTAERQEETMRRMNEQYADLPLRDRDWTDKNGNPDPADVPAGEAWQVNVDGRTVAAFRMNPGNSRPWIIPIRIQDTALPFCWFSDSDVRLVSRLVPEQKPRMVTDEADLRALPDGTVIRTSDTAVLEQYAGAWSATGSGLSITPGDVDLPATILYTPKVTE